MAHSSFPVEPYSFCWAMAARSAAWSSGDMATGPRKRRVKAGWRSRTARHSELT